jgi:hypothetical protein
MGALGQLAGIASPLWARFRLTADGRDAVRRGCPVLAGAGTIGC